MTAIPPTYAFPAARAAQAYGMARPAAATPAAAFVEKVKPAAPVEPVARIGPKPLGGKLAEKAAGLLAGRVSGEPFAPRTAPVTNASMAIYRHPADRNAAAVGVDLGKRIDLNG